MLLTAVYTRPTRSSCRRVALPQAADGLARSDLPATAARVSFAPNFAYELCLRRVKPSQIDALDLSSWRVAGCGAEPIRPETLAAFAERFSRAGFRASSFVPSYGLAEHSLAVAFAPRQAEGRRRRRRTGSVASRWPFRGQRHRRPSASSGAAAPFPGHDVRIVDDERRPPAGAACRPDRRARSVGHGRVLRRSRGDGRRAPRRLAAHRRPRLHGRRRAVRVRPDEGSDHPAGTQVSSARSRIRDRRRRRHPVVRRRGLRHQPRRTKPTRWWPCSRRARAVGPTSVDRPRPAPGPRDRRSRARSGGRRRRRARFRARRAARSGVRRRERASRPARSLPRRSADLASCDSSMNLFDKLQPIAERLAAVGDGPMPFDTVIDESLRPDRGRHRRPPHADVRLEQLLRSELPSRGRSRPRRHALARDGAGTTGSRAANGTYAAHRRARAGRSRDVYGKPHALVFTTGYQANLGAHRRTVRARRRDLLDIESHASIYDGARLSGAQIFAFRHNSPADLRRKLAGDRPSRPLPRRRRGPVLDQRRRRAAGRNRRTSAARPARI